VSVARRISDCKQTTSYCAEISLGCFSFATVLLSSQGSCGCFEIPVAESFDVEVAVAESFDICTSLLSAAVKKRSNTTSRVDAAWAVYCGMDSAT
jgi:hypothetical protein